MDSEAESEEEEEDILGNLMFSYGIRINGIPNLLYIYFGHYGQVFKCVHRIDGVKYVVKRILLNDKDKGKLPMEIFALLRLHHNNIVRYHQVWKERYVSTGRSPISEDKPSTSEDSFRRKCYFIHMEDCPRTLDNIRDAQEVDMIDVLHWLTQLADALSFIHGEGFIHCDLKPSNVLLDIKDNIKICDFGLARFKDGRKEANVSVELIKHLRNQKYRAPELSRALSQKRWMCTVWG